MLKYEGAHCFRQKVVCATLAGKPLKLSNIRVNHENVGLTGQEHPSPPSSLLPPLPSSTSSTP